jgi:hypothetical protein
LEKIAPEGIAPGALYTAWILFGFAIVSVIISFRLSQAALDHEIAWLDSAWTAVQKRETQLPQRLPNRYRAFTRVNNIASGVLFVGGIVFLAWFAASNWPSRRISSGKIPEPLEIEIKGQIVPKDYASDPHAARMTETSTPSAAKGQEPKKR